MTETFDDFQQDFEDRLDDIRRADWRNFSLALADLLQLLDQSPYSSSLVKGLEEQVDFDSWFAAAKVSVRSMVGSGKLNWSSDRAERLAQQLGIVRWLAANENNLTEYSSSFSWAGSNLNDNKYKATDELIEPFARNLFRHIERNRQSMPSIPAADRVVPLNHNSVEMKELEDTLGAVEAEMAVSNSLKSEPEFDRNLAELSAGRRLLIATAVRLSALGAVLMPALKWLTDHAAAGAIGVAVTAAIALLASLFGLTIPGL